MVGAWYDYNHIDETVAYQIFCFNQPVSQSDSCLGKYVLFTTNFKASFTNQTVVSWTEDRAPVSLEGCAVATAGDWQCRDKKNQYSGITTMRDGKYLGVGPLKSDSIFTIGKWHYRLLAAKKWFEPYLTKK